MPLIPKIQELFTIVVASGLYTHKRVPQDMLNASKFFQPTMSEVFGQLEEVSMVWINNLVIWYSLEGELVSNLAEELGKLSDVGFFLPHAINCNFFESTSKGCGNIYSFQGCGVRPGA